MDKTTHNFYDENFKNRDRKMFKIKWYTREFYQEGDRLIEDMSAEISSYNALSIRRDNKKNLLVPYIAFVNSEHDIPSILKFTNDYGHLTRNVIEDKLRAHNDSLQKIPFQVDQSIFIKEAKKMKFLVELYSCLHTVKVENISTNKEKVNSNNAFFQLTNFFEKNDYTPLGFELLTNIKLQQLAVILEICNYSPEKLSILLSQGDEDTLGNICLFCNLPPYLQKRFHYDGKFIFDYCYKGIKLFILSIITGVCSEYINTLKIFVDPNMIRFDSVEYKGTLLSAMYFRFYLDIFMKQTDKIDKKLVDKNATIPIRKCPNCNKLFVVYYNYDKHFCTTKCGHNYYVRNSRQNDTSKIKE